MCDTRKLGSPSIPTGNEHLKYNWAAAPQWLKDGLRHYADIAEPYRWNVGIGAIMIDKPPNHENVLAGANSSFGNPSVSRHHVSRDNLKGVLGLVQRNGGNRYVMPLRLKPPLGRVKVEYLNPASFRVDPNDRTSPLDGYMPVRHGIK
jgi:hypothetical protein